MTKEEKGIVMAVFGTLLHEHTWNELNAEPFCLGSLTIDGMAELYKKLKYEDYCKEHGIRYEDMTESDYMDYAEEEARKMGYDF